VYSDFSECITIFGIDGPITVVKFKAGTKSAHNMWGMFYLQQLLL
jgi:hypothetical protein